MSGSKRVKDLMVDVFEYPHIPYWFTIQQAIKIIKISFLDTKKYPQPLTMLVFDEKYNLLGLLTLEEILKGLEPALLKSITTQEKGESDPSVIWESLFGNESKALVSRPVGDIMIPVKFFVEPDDLVEKAAYLMVHNNLVLLPVIENKKKLGGVVRMLEVFDEVLKKVV